MVTITTAGNVLKTVYEKLLGDQLNIEATPLAQKIAMTERNIVGGAKVVKAAPYGVNGGTGSFSESGSLPIAGGNYHVNFESTLKNIGGVMHISDKVMKSSLSDKAAFVNLLTSETEGLKKGARLTYARQFYLDGTGVLTACGVTDASVTVNVASAQYLIEGMIVDIVTTATGEHVTNGTARRILAVNRGESPSIVLAGTAKVTTAATNSIVEQGSFGNEMTGLKSVFAQTGNIYGLSKADYPWLKPYVNSNAGALSDKLIIDAIIDRENMTGCKIDMLMVHPLVYTDYYDYIESTKKNVNTLDLKGGFQALSVSGRPMAQDRFMPSATMYLLDTSEFKVHQLADWEFMDRDGAVLKWDSGYAAYKAVLIKYCEMICDKPGAQAELSGITSAT